MTKKLKTFMTTPGIDGKEVEFAFDESNNLCVDGKRVVTREIVQLRWVELIALCFTACAVVIQAVFSVLTYFRC